ncbi:HupE/UreJ family protein [Litorisediminicola beolgyonensis]|uniref:HupE/UreJ family protein n=1 Tax=Litorisediminicola beolgyonensis TaxID=1173614 RepID=A0ABW3ZHK2_9RHOB
MRFVLLCLAVLGWSAAAQAHEVRPAIADLEVTGGRLSLEVTLNAEALLVGADLEGVADTDALEASDEIDALRKLPPEDLAARLDADAAAISDALSVTANGTPVGLALDRIAPGPVDDPSLPRDTQLGFTAELPPGASELVVTWPANWGMLVLRQQGVDEPYTGYLEGGVPSEPIALEGGGEMSAGRAFLAYIPVGFEHIVPMGLDHILFVLGLFFLSTRLGPLLWQISAFTAAHTVTLALGALGIVSIPGAIVEPLIAASIVFVAVENIVSDGLSRWRPVVVFLFGLLHGLGFAAVLGEFGLPSGQFIPALLGFNIGVEIGQLSVIAAAFALVYVALGVDALEISERTGYATYGVLTLSFTALALLLGGTGFAAAMGAPAPVFLLPLAGLSLLCLISVARRDVLNAYRAYVAIPASAAIGLVGLWWVIERVFL